MWYELLNAFLAWALILPTVFGIGSRFRFLIQTENHLLSGVLYCALGTACLSYGVLLLDIFKVLNPLAIWMLLAVLFFLTANSLKDFFSWLKTLVEDLRGGSSPYSKILSWIFFISFLVILTGSLSPEIGGDALCYHLNLPKVFLSKGSLAPDYYDINSYFPLFVYNLYLIGLAFGSMAAAKLFHLFFGFLLFLTIKVVVSKETKNKTIGYFAALIVWLTPAIYSILSTSYVDVALMFYSFLALVVMVGRFGRDTQKTFFLSGFFIGSALSIKYLALIGVLGLGAVWLYETLKNRRFAESLGGLSLWCVGLAAGSAYWIVRNWIVAGNPFFPYFSSIFGTEPIPNLRFHLQTGAGRDWFSFLSIFWNLFYQPQIFGAFESRIGVFYFLLLPFFLLAFLFSPYSRSYVLFGIVVLIGWFYAAQVPRYMLPALPAVIVASSFGLAWVNLQLSQTTRSIAQRFACGAALVILSGYLLAGAYHYRYSYLLFSGQWSRNEYLRKMERTIPIAEWINGNLPREVKILVDSEPRQYYIDRPVIRNIFFRYRTHFDQKNLSPEGMRHFFKEIGITHFLMSAPEGKEEFAQKRGSLEEFLVSSYIRKIKSVMSENIRDARHYYELYELK